MFHSQPRARPSRLGFADSLAQLFKAGLEPGRTIERRTPREQFVEQHPEGINVRTSVTFRRVESGLLRTQVGRRADELIEARDQSLVREFHPCRGFGDAEVNHFGQRHAFVGRDQDV